MSMENRPKYISHAQGKKLVEAAMEGIAPPALPDPVQVATRYEAPIKPSVPTALINDESDAATGLNELTLLALAKAREILELPLSPDDMEFATVLRAQASQVQTVLSIQTRVDEGRLRAKNADAMPKLLEILQEERKKLPRVLN